MPLSSSILLLTFLNHGIFLSLSVWRVAVHLSHSPTMQQAMEMEAKTICTIVGCDGAQVAATTMDIWRLVLTGWVDEGTFARIAHWYMCAEGLGHLGITCSAGLCLVRASEGAAARYRYWLLYALLLFDIFYTVYMSVGLFWCSTHLDFCLPSAKEDGFFAGVQFGIFAATMVWLQNLSVAMDVCAYLVPPATSTRSIKSD